MKDGITYAPRGAKPQPVVAPGEFKIAAAYFDHGHIFGQINGLTEAGAELAMIYDPSPDRLKTLKQRFPQAHLARSFITGTKGVIEIRKYFDFGRSDTSDQIFLADGNSENVLPVHGEVGFPFFGQLIVDCLDRSEKAMTQAHAFAASRLSLQAQQWADRAR